MSKEELRQILASARTVAVVGVSDNPERESYKVAKFLMDQGYHILPVNPTIEQISGIPAFGSLRDITEPVDVVDVFRRAENVMPVVEDAIAIGAKVVWMQLGIVNEEAAQKAREAGLQVVMDHCMKIEYRRLMASKPV